ncbi:hypothetical protein [Pontibacter oryzae]|uniref:Uncharacterized protein n=1 Tax=Pontibacter oryzae TaxID=2304593 RepID=A0A399SHY7_9BACT|nr:hypothetical protein [Pontibacter oryzae]RIJ42631.1 hypothetical protein D1627_01885 [Pontibacter oryzae]
MSLITAKTYRFTRALVLASMAGSCLTVLSLALGFGELYPFATWKLYTQPLGSKREVKEYRIYTQQANSSTWQRQPVHPAATFTQDEYVYTLNALTQAATAATGDTLAAQTRLLLFTRTVAPGAAKYKIVEERYNPQELLQNANAYDTLTIVRFR